MSASTQVAQLLYELKSVSSQSGPALQPSPWRSPSSSTQSGSGRVVVLSVVGLPVWLPVVGPIPVVVGSESELELEPLPSVGALVTVTPSVRSPEEPTLILACELDPNG